MCLMDITALITPIHSAVMLKYTEFADQDKKKKTQGMFLNLEVCKSVTFLCLPTF